METLKLKREQILSMNLIKNGEVKINENTNLSVCVNPIIEFITHEGTYTLVEEESAGWTQTSYKTSLVHKSAEEIIAEFHKKYDE